MFLDLVSDWEALSYWDLTSADGDANLISSFTDKAIEVIMYNSMLYSDYFPNNLKVVTDMEDLLTETRSSNGTTVKEVYSTRNAFAPEVNKYVLLNEPFP